MSNLRLLIIDSLIVPNDQRHLALPNNLRYLSWSHCPFKCLASNDKQKAFVQLDLQDSKFEYLWEGVMVILFILTALSIIFIIISLFFKCGYKYKYTPGVFELPPFIYKFVLI